MFTKAWVVPWEQGSIGIAYERADGIRGFIQLQKSGHPDLPALMEKLSEKDLHEIEQRLTNVIPFNRPKH